MASGKKRRARSVVLGLVIIALGLAVAIHVFGDPRDWRLFLPTGLKEEAKSSDRSPVETAEAVELTEKQLQSIGVGDVEDRVFQPFIDVVGSIDANQDLTLQVFPQYQGKIIKPFVDVDDRVTEGQPLYTIDSPDLLQAQATFLQTAGVLDLNTRNLTRLRGAVRVGGGAQKDLDQAVSDQLTAQGAYNSARDLLHIFGMSETAITQLLVDHKVDSSLTVRSPISGLITARNAAPGTFVQPGVAPAPYTVTNAKMVRMYAYVVESDVPAIKKGLGVSGRVLAYPDRVFRGTVTTPGATVDPTTHRLQVESLIGDPDHLLRPGMFANLTILTGPSFDAVAVPLDAVVREGDGTTVVWVETSHGHFSRRPVKIGRRQGDYHEVLNGLRKGERIATENALLLSNIVNAGTTE